MSANVVEIAVYEAAIGQAVAVGIWMCAASISGSVSSAMGSFPLVRSTRLRKATHLRTVGAASRRPFGDPGI